MMSRLGVLGGMFDPVHKGHVAAANHAANLLQLDLVKMVPCKQPNHRADAIASSVHRLAMLEIAIEGQVKLEVDDCEIARAGISYSADTIRQIRDAKVAEKIVFILGMDALNSINRWHAWQSLFANAHFLVLARSQETLNTDTAAAINFDDRRTNSPEQLFEAEAGRIYISNDFSSLASSTAVRAELRESSHNSQLLNQSVLNYINENQLYC